MENIQTIQDFYKNKCNWMPEVIQKEIGHFNVFRREEYCGNAAKPIPYSRKDYYKISLIIGKNKYFYADKSIDIDKSALVFSNPMIPYSCESTGDKQEGAFCIFTESFFFHFGNIKDYPVFQPGNNPIFFPVAKELKELKEIFNKMLKEINSDYIYKYDLLRAMVMELVHKAIKMEPAKATLYQGSNANTRIASLFTELLERQFPIESPMQNMQLRMPADFAESLSVHINHLNRALKIVTGKTTSQLIADRILQEARILLKHTDWNISEIGYCLGFEEPSHFIGFFKKNTTQTPRAYRK
ncbi:MAG: helix-turn-helix transcriptional regulator [Arachidicoccus sp.]|nr:helix-turn-helix transcriptional regulator [Arachidicoccus sp.]